MSAVWLPSTKSIGGKFQSQSTSGLEEDSETMWRHFCNVLKNKLHTNRVWLQVWLRFSKLSGDNVQNTKASMAKSYLRNHLVKHKIQQKDEESPKDLQLTLACLLPTCKKLMMMSFLFMFLWKGIQFCFLCAGLRKSKPWLKTDQSQTFPDQITWIILSGIKRGEK